MRTAFVLAAVIALPAFASAQTASQPINVSATVQSAVSFSNTSALSFGSPLTPGAAATVTPANGGKTMVSFNTPATVTISGTVMTHTTIATATFPVTYSCAQDPTGVSATPTAFPGTCAAGYTTVLVGNAKTDRWMYVGGAIGAGVTSSSPAGAYAGTITVTATYTTF